MLSLARDRSRPRRPKSATLFLWDFTQQSAGALSLPTGLTFARASSGHTVRTGTSTITTSGITSNDVGRIGRLSSSHNRGLFLEPARTNVYGYANTPGSASGTAGSSGSTFTTGRTGPDGGTTATRIEQTSGTFSRYHSITTAGASTPYTLSSWVAAGLGSGAYSMCAPYTGTSGAAITGTATAAWARQSHTYTYPSTSGANLVGEDGRANGTSGAAAGARDVDVAWIQFEVGSYPTSSILTSAGATATRAAERLTIDSTRSAASVVSGRAGVYLRLRALAASTELSTGEGWLLYWPDGDGGWYVDDATRSIYGYNGASESETAAAAISWARGDLLEFAIECGAGTSSLRWRKNSGAVQTASFSVHNDSWGSLDWSSGTDVCNVAGAGQFPAIVEQVATFAPGWGPM